MKMYFQVALIIFLASEILGKIKIFPQVSNFIKYGKNEICKTESDLYKRNLGNYTTWAHKMMDSSAKNAFGALAGNDYNLGNYEECLNIQGPFPTQYCIVGLTINVPPLNSTGNLLDSRHNQYGSVFTKLEHYIVKNVKLGMCFPSSCSASDIQISLSKTLNKVENHFKAVGITYTVTSSNEFCSDYVNPKRFGVLETIFCILSVALVIFALIGTMGDSLGITEENPNKFCLLFKKLCLSFSIRRNWYAMFKAEGHQIETKIFNGIRSICVIIIFFGHFSTALTFIPSINSLTIDAVNISKIHLAVAKFDLMVDIFFLMGGLLLVHGILKKWNTIDINPVRLIFLRYIRLTPLNLYVSLYYVTMFPYFGSGPMWSLIYTGYVKTCVQNNNWWLNILYINNFMIDLSETCNDMNWYIACDFQLFIVGVIVMFIMKKNLRVGYTILAILFTLSIIASFAITKIYEFAPYFGAWDTEENKLFLNKYYIKPYTRASSYFLGMLGGIIYDKLKSREAILSKMNSYAVTGVSLLAMSASYAYIIFAYNGEENYMFEFAIYNALHRPIWCIGFLGICIVASFGSIPAIRLFLSSSFWTPFAKLTYGFYLIHEMTTFGTLIRSGTRIGTGIFDMTSLSLPLLVTSFIISSFLYVVVEAPFVQIFKIITPSKFYEKPLSVSEEKGAIEFGYPSGIEDCGEEDITLDCK